MITRQNNWGKTDLETALNMVCQDALFHNMLLLSLAINLLKINRSFLENRKFQVRTDGITSEVRYIAAGVPYGSALSTFLFLLYVNYILITNKTNLALFVDYRAILVSAKK